MILSTAFAENTRNSYQQRGVDLDFASVYNIGMDNIRNNYGVKDASKTYRKGGWSQYTDFAGSILPNEMAEAKDIETAKVFVEKVAKSQNPECEFKVVKIYPEGFYRIYYRNL